MKRLVESLLVIVTAIVWIPILIAVSIAVFVSMGRPILFIQERAGLRGRPFRLMKLRTMRGGDGSDAERTTRTGRMLRALSLDELPQLFQVLSGKMSLVGPRPLPTAYLPRYSKEQMRRHDVRPGITGWAQVNGRNAISWERKFELDVWYVEHKSFLLDLKILFMTVFKTLGSKGINSSESETMPEFKGSAKEN